MKIGKSEHNFGEVEESGYDAGENREIRARCRRTRNKTKGSNPGMVPENLKQNKGFKSGGDAEEPETNEVIESGRDAREPKTKGRD